MQPPPQAVSSGVAGPPPAGNPRSLFWANSPYRRPASNNAPVAPITRPLQPVTDPFAFNRQTLQNTPVGSSSKSSLPSLPGPALSAFSQWPGLPVPPTNAVDSSTGLHEPLSGTLLQPRADTSPFPSASTPSSLPGPEMNRSAEVGSSSGPEVQILPHPPHYIPGVGPEQPLGGHLNDSDSGSDQPMNRHTPHGGAVAQAASPFFPQPQKPGQWGPVQGGPQPSYQHHSPCPEGLVQNMGPQATSLPHFPSPSSLYQGPGHESHVPLMSTLASLASGEGNEVDHQQSKNHSLSSFPPKHTFEQNSRVGNMWASPEFRQNPGVNKEYLLDPAHVNPFNQGNSPENQVHRPSEASANYALQDTASGSLSVFFQGEETENEENLSSEKAGLDDKLDLDGFSSTLRLGHPPPPAHGTGGVYQGFPKSPSSEAAQEGDVQYFSQSMGVRHDRQTTITPASDTWGDASGSGTHCASGPQCENVENLEFVQNQEVLPRETSNVDPSSLSDQFQHGPLPGPAVSRPVTVGLTRGGGLNLEAPDTPVHPTRPDSVSSSYSSHSHRSPPESARPQELVGTFIQQEVGKLEDDTSGSFFKQIDSSPVGGETDEMTGSQNYCNSLSQPSAPSPPKPTGVFQTSANSSFEPVKSHLVGVKPVEADRANMVVEVRGIQDCQQKRRAAAVPPDATPGNLEQPPDNMETLCAPQACPLSLSTTGEVGHLVSHTAGPPLDIVRPVPEKRPSARAQGPVKCESPATTLWAQNELPDFGGNVLLAPAAPALYVPVKPKPSEVIHHPEKGMSGQQSQKPGSMPPLQNQDPPGASENLENPPKVGEEEALPLQASSGYASLLSSPPTESLHNQPVLIAQPDQSYNLAQPINFSVSLLNPNEKNQSLGDAVVGEKSIVSSSRALSGDPEEHAALSDVPTSAVTGLSLPNSVPRGSGSSEMIASQPASLLVQLLSPPVPKNSFPKSQNPNAEKGPSEFVNSPAGSTSVMLVPPANSTLVPTSNKANYSSNQEDAVGALDFTLNRTLENPVRIYSPSHSNAPATQQAFANHPRQFGPGLHNQDHFYQQVTKDAQDQYSLETAQTELVPPQPQNSPPQVPQAACPEPSNPESPPTQGQSESLAQPPAGPAPVNMGQQQLPQPPQSSSASGTSTSSSQAAVRSEQPWLPPPPPSAFGPAPQDLASYYYYRPLYDAYHSHYPSPYPSDPGTASLFYQDIYGLYEPRYRPYDSSASAYAENHRYSEAERPSSRASHYSDQLTPRQGNPEGYYNSKSGWSSQSDYYANYYSGQYDYGGRHWDRYYGSRFRDPRTWDRRYWYDSEHDPHRKEKYASSDRPEKCDDHWRYDPRFTGSFDDDTELHRDPYGEEVDRRSIHSEHSARSLRSTHSLPSRRSSLGSHSHQSQIYRSHNVTGGSFDAPHAPGSFHGDYAYGTYTSNFNGAHGFPEYNYSADTSWPAVEQVPSRPTSPEKFSAPHVCARFGPGGQLLKVIPNLPSEGQPALVEIHSLETLLQHTPEQEEMRSFPGPLGKDDTHKVDVINFAQNKATKCLQNESLIDKESASLLWNFIILLCRQNGTVVGTDIAELLLRDHRTVWLPGKSPNETNLIDFTNEAMEQVEEEESGEAQLSFLTDSQMAATSVLEKDTERFRELLLYGRKKDALESAMKNGLWGHALLLASKMDSRTHARVMTRFANSLPINDPLQTVYQLMSGRMPAASTCCGDEKWGDWRPHLAMVLSNLNNNMDVESRTMSTMGDTLASKGLLDAAHFCYLMAQVGFGVYTKKTTKLVLIGSNHSLPFLKFATNEAIQRTEAYEYAQSLGVHTCSLPNFQVFKFIYLCRLAEMGLATQAFHYCEVIAKSVLTQPGAYSPVLISQLIQMASQLRLFDPQLKEKPEEESFVEPTWLVQLRHVEKQIQEGAVLWSQKGTDPQQCRITPGSKIEQLDGPGLSQQVGPTTFILEAEASIPNKQPLTTQQLVGVPKTFPDGQPAHLARVPMFPVPVSQSPQEMGPTYGLSGSALGFPESSRSDPAVLHPGPALPPPTPCLQESGPPLQEARSPDPEMVPQGSPVRHSPPALNEEEFGGNFADPGSSRTAQDLETPPVWDCGSSSVTPASEGKKPAQVVKKEVKEPKKSESWFSRWLPGKKRTEAYLPDDKNKSIVWDEKKNQWVNLNEPEEEKKAPPPPPTSFPKVPQAAPTGPTGPPTASVNMFSRKAGGSRARYVDVLNPSGTQRSEPVLAPSDFFAPLAPLPIPSNLFIPNPDAEESHPADGTQSKAEPTLEPKCLRVAVLKQGKPNMISSLASLPGPELSPSKLDGSQGGEEVSRHFHQAPGDHCPAGATPGGSVPFYNPAQLVQASVTSGSSRPGRIGQRKYAALN
ncbi:transport protein Sec16A isoform X1 [Sigmodon hispidus]